MTLPLHIVVAVTLLAATTVSAADWPSYLGPTGNFSTPSDARLLDDMTKVRPAWTSEEQAIGYGKTNTAFARSGGKPFDGFAPGGMSGPVVAGGVVVMPYFVPTGDVLDAAAKDLPEKLHDVWRVAADDVVVGIHATTGKTKWKRSYPGGINTSTGKRGGWAVMPCVADGIAFSLGTTGRVFALELETGKTVWEGDIGAAHKRLVAARDKGLADKKLAGSMAGVHSQYGILMVIEGVLLCPDWDGGLIGYEAATGKQLWHLESTGKSPYLSGFNAPAPVRVGGKTLAVCVNGPGDLRLFEPKIGKVLWTHALACNHLTQPVFGEEFLLAFVPHPDARKDRKPGADGLLAGFKLTETGPERVWTLPAEYPHELCLDGGPARRVIPRAGFVYYLMWGRVDGQLARRLMVLNEKTGDVMAKADVDFNQFYLWGDRVVALSDNQHRPRVTNPEVWQLHSADPKTFKHLGKGWRVNDPATPAHNATGGYELPVYEAFADGFAYFRVIGGIKCYDLRATNTKEPNR